MTALPTWIGWFQWLSPIRYGNEALGHTQFDETDNVMAQGFLELEGFTLGYWKCVAAMIGWSVFWNLLSVISLARMVRKSEK